MQSPIKTTAPLDPCGILERARIECFANRENKLQDALGWVILWHSECHLRGTYDPAQGKLAYDTLLFALEAMGGKVVGCEDEPPAFVCDNCGRTDGTPVHIDGQSASRWSTSDDSIGEFDGCTMCGNPKPPAEVPVYDLEEYMEAEPF